ncbi:hypothetical protein K6677_001685, partial [Vibrio vulnificus]|nr:hypothetical protein [Vibrio vulnificus]
LNALLCLSFNDLRFPQTKINSALIHEQKPRPEKLKRLIDLKNRLRILAIQAQKPVIKILIEPAELTSRLPENRLRQFSEFPAPKNRCPESSARRSQLADKHKTNKPREQEKMQPTDFW